LQVGVRLQALPNCELQNDGTDIFKPGDYGRILVIGRKSLWCDVSEDRFAMTWERTGASSIVPKSLWAESLKYISGAPTLQVGIRLQALPNFEFQKDGIATKLYRRPGWLKTKLAYHFKPGDHGWIYKCETYTVERFAVKCERTGRISTWPKSWWPACFILESVPTVPTYWQCSHTTGDFHKVVASQCAKSMLQNLLNDTALARGTVDRMRLGSGSVRVGFEIVSAQRIEDSQMWERYVGTRRRIRDRGVKTPIDVKTTAHLAQEMRQTLDHDVNEAYLFHGTNMGAAKSISEIGFSIKFAGKVGGTAYGRGAYFAERSTKSDEYAQRRAVQVGLITEEHCVMLLCRVCLGEAYRVEDFDSKAGRHVLGNDEYDSLLGDREAKVGSYREFIVYDEAQVYPEYVIVYKACDNSRRET